MALPHLIKYVYNNGSDEVIRRGKKIHAMGFVELVEHDQLMGGVVFRVKMMAMLLFTKCISKNIPMQNPCRCAAPALII